MLMNDQLLMFVLYSTTNLTSELLEEEEFLSLYEIVNK